MFSKLKMYHYLLLSVASVLLMLSACTSAQTENTAPPADVPRAEYLYEKKCTRCHEFYNPQEYRQKTMRYYFKKYAAKAGIKKDDRTEVLDWALAQCRDAPLAK